MISKDCFLAETDHEGAMVSFIWFWLRPLSLFSRIALPCQDNHDMEAGFVRSESMLPF